MKASRAKRSSPGRHAHSGDHRRDCRDLLLRMARDLENDLPADERRALRRHLKNCERCGGFSRDLTRTVDICRELGSSLGMSQQARRRARANVRRLLG